MSTLDAIDYRLLSLMQLDATLPLHELGDRIGLSTSAVQRRLTRLREAGVVSAQVAVLDPRKMGLGLTTVVLVEMAEDDAESSAAFCKRMLAEPAVQQCYSVAGQWDYVVVMVTADLAAYQEKSRVLFVADRTVLRYETLPAYGSVKSSLALPLPADG